MKELVANGQLREIVNIPWFAVLKKCSVMQEGWWYLTFIIKEEMNSNTVCNMNSSQFVWHLFKAALAQMKRKTGTCQLYIPSYFPVYRWFDLTVTDFTRTAIKHFLT